ncbi:MULTISPECIES: hypothetical protein [Microbacterium]|uniref:hypothetical protein n=1 Tax=Microbacterium TaxID=33882 RepID=UPI0027E33021|nr:MULTISPECIES: hypothetical protein [Microbacterium]
MPRRFLTGESTGRGLSPDRVTDLATLAEARWRALDIAPDTVHELFQAVEKEPRLLARMLELGFEAEQFDARLIEQRENLHSGDLRAEVAAQVVGAIVRTAAGEFLKPGNTDTFIEIFERRIGAARDLFVTQTALMGTPASPPPPSPPRNRAATRRSSSPSAASGSSSRP